MTSRRRPQHEVRSRSRFSLPAGGPAQNALRIGSWATDYHLWFRLMILPQVHLRKPCYDLYFL